MILLVLVNIVLYLTQFIYRNYQVPETVTFSANDTSTLSSSANVRNPKLAIILDDFGLNRAGIEEAMSINRHLTFAIMPFLKYSKQDAITAHTKGYEVIVHLPMQSQKRDNSRWLGPRPISLNLKDSDIDKITSDSINAVPYAAGLNIHMGALASEDKRVVSAVMRVVKRKKLYFVDSVTSSRTVCGLVAKNIGVPFIERNVFLEGSSKNKSYVKQQLSVAEKLALKNGYAVVIGHVGSAGGKATIQAIKETIPEMEGRGIRLVYVSELLK
jgi:polysaccharide deacetylase 2 family uncharacterized protein YibQ